MRKYRRSISVLLLALSLVALLGACASKNLKEPELSAIVENIDDAIGNTGNMVAVDADYIKGSMKMDVSAYKEYCVKINAIGANVDEYGVFKGSDSKQAAEIKKAVEGYLQMRLDTWMDEYMPEEKPKVSSAELETQGNYVCYCILSEESKKAAFNAFRNSFQEA